MEPATYTLPSSLFVICIMSSMAFVVCAIRWLVNICNGCELGQSFSSAIWGGQIHIFFFVLIVSLCIAFYDFFFAEQPLDILGEVIILCGAYAILLKGGRDMFLKRALSFTGRYMTLGILCLLGWCFTLLIGGIFYMLCMYLTAMASQEFMVVVVFLTGLTWAGAVTMLYLRVLKHSEKRVALEGKSLASFLWPVLFAYFILLVPLVIQNTTNSEEWQDSMRAKPIKRI